MAVVVVMVVVVMVVVVMVVVAAQPTEKSHFRPLFSLFSTNFFRHDKIVAFNRIVGVEGEYADHLTTITAQMSTYKFAG